MPISLAHDVQGRDRKRNPLSEYEMKLAEADDNARAVIACPFGCGQPDYPKLDEYGICDHVVGFSNCSRPDGSPLHSPDGPVRKPEGAMVELFVPHDDPDPKKVRDALKRRKLSGNNGPLLAGDYLVRVNGTTRRVYRELPKPEVAKEVVVPPREVQVAPPANLPTGMTAKTAIAPAG